MAEKNTLLIVDDYEFNRRMLREMLPGFEVIEAENGFKAIEEYEKHKDEVCAVLSDIMMPVLDGFGLLEYFYKNKYVENVPVFIISADNSSKALQKAYNMGAQDVINKPFNRDFVRKRIENIIELYRLREILSRTRDDEDDDFLADGGLPEEM